MLGSLDLCEILEKSGYLASEMMEENFGKR